MWATVKKACGAAEVSHKNQFACAAKWWQKSQGVPITIPGGGQGIAPGKTQWQPTPFPTPGCHSRPISAAQRSNTILPPEISTISHLPPRTPCAQPPLAQGTLEPQTPLTHPSRQPRCRRTHPPAPGAPASPQGRPRPCCAGQTAGRPRWRRPHPPGGKPARRVLRDWGVRRGVEGSVAVPMAVRT
jgi:hypothetical protein